ncbi:MAG: IS3 family transposase [Hyphomicrobiales bacterium]|nr:IS3 family transposase [Hyphomicrobiales bacterium]
MPSKARIFSREFKVSVIRRMLAGENVSAIARELQVRRKDLYVWRDRFRAGGAEALRGRGRPPKRVAAPPSAAADLATAQRRIAELERKIGQQQLELDFFRRALWQVSGRRRPSDGSGAVYALIDAMTTPLPQGGLPVERLCALAGVSRAGDYRRWQEAAPRREQTAVCDAIQRLALAHRHYGYRRIAAQLHREGMAVNRKRVLRLMREDNLLCLRKRPFVPVTTDTRHAWRVVPNRARGMAPSGLDQLWVADITDVRLVESFAYLAVVLDAFSRRVLGWALETHLDVSLALAALDMALAARRPAPDSLIHHSDRGVQYACEDDNAKLAAHRIQPSMSRVGNPYDNAKAESFMKTLKQEEVDGRDYHDVAAVRGSIARFLEEVYNRQRLHSALGYRPPVEFEESLPALPRARLPAPDAIAPAP